MSHKRCVGCQLSPLPQDIIYYWGDSPESLANPRCLACRGKEPVMSFSTVQKKVVVVIVEKFEGLRSELCSEHILGPALRDCLRLRQYGAEVYLTDGQDRIWQWSQFPMNRVKPLGWEEFLKYATEWTLWELDGNTLREITEDEEPEPTEPIVSAANVFEHVKL
jgi:hypothetical protein